MYVCVYSCVNTVHIEPMKPEEGPSENRKKRTLRENNGTHR